MRRAASLTTDRASGRVWGGTFHSIANRLLRRHGTAVGIDPGFTVLDQADTEALLGMIRTELGFGEQKTRFPRAETIAAVYSRTVNEQEKLDPVLRQRFPWCAEHADELRQVFAAYRSRKLEHQVLDYDDLLLYWWALLDGPVADTVRGAVRPRARRRVPGHQPPPGGDPGQAVRRRRQSHGGRRRRPGDLLVPGGVDREHPPLPRRLPWRRGRDAGAELPVDPADPRRRQRGDRRLHRALPEAVAVHQRPTAPSPTWSPAPTRPPRPTTCATWCSPTARKEWPCATRRCCSAPATTPTGSSSSWPAGASPSSSTAGSSSSRRPTSRTCSPCSASSTTPATPWRGTGWSAPSPGSGRPPPTACCRTAASTADAEGGDLVTGFCRMVVNVPAHARPPLAELRTALAGGPGGRRPRTVPGGPDRPDAALPRDGRRSPVRRCRGAPGRPGAARRARLRLQQPQPLPHRAHPRPTGIDVGPGRPSPPRRRLPGAVHHPFGQGWGVGRRLRHPRRRRQHPLGHGAGRARRGRGGAEAAVRRPHPGAPAPPCDVPPALLPPAFRERRPSLVRPDEPVPRPGEGTLHRLLHGRRGACGSGAASPKAGTDPVAALLANLFQ